MSSRGDGGQEHERERLAALDRYEVLDTEPEAAFDDLVMAAAAIANTPFASVSLVDEHRQWFKAFVGFDQNQTDRAAAICDLVVQDEDEVIIDDTLLEPRLAANPDVIGGARYRFYAGFPLRTPEGAVLGTLCVVDQKPGQLTGGQLQVLRTLAAQVMAQLQLRLELRQRDQLLAERQRAYDQLAKSENRYRFLIENSSDVISQHDTDGRVRYVSPTVATLLGGAPGEPVSWTIPERTHPADQHQATEAWKAAVRGQTARVVQRVLHPDGEYRHVESTMTPITGLDGSVNEVLVTTRDVTERRMAELALEETRAALAKQSELLEQAQTLAQVGSWSTDLITDQVTWSREAHRILGTDPEIPLTTTTFLEYVHAEDQEPVRRAVAQAFEHGQSDDLEFRVITAGGQTRYLRSRYQVDKDAGGRPVRLSGIMLDITQARQAQQEVADTKELLEQVLNSATEQAIACTDLNGTIMIFSRGAELILGHRAADVIGTPAPYSGLAPHLAPHAASAIDQIRAGASEVRRDAQWIRPDGVELIIQLILTPMRNSSGEVVGVVSIGTDVTQQRQAEAALAAAKAEAEERRAQLEEAQRLASIGSWTIDLRTGHVLWSPEQYRITGVDVETPLSLSLYTDLAHPDDRQQAEALHQSAQDGTPYSNELRLIRPDGREVLVLVHGRAELDETGQVVKLHGTTQDITDRRRIENDLLRANDLFEQLLSSATAQAIIGIDSAGHVTIFNRGAEQMLGYRAGDIVGTAQWESFHEQDELPLIQSLHAMLRDETDEQAIEAHLSSAETPDWTFVRSDGSRLKVQIRFSPMRGTSGRVTGVVAIATDVTQQRKAEAALGAATAEIASRSEQLEEAQQIAAVGSWSIDLVTGVESWSRQMFRLFGGAPDTMVPGLETFESMLHPEDAGRFKAEMAQAAGTGSSWSVEHRLVLPTAEVRDVLSRGQVDTDETGRPVRIHGISQDITDIRRTQRELIAARDQFVQLLGAATDQAIVGTGPDGRINLFNKGAERMLGYTAEEAFGSTPWDLLHDRDELAARAATVPRGDVLDVLLTTTIQGEGGREWTWVRKNGERVAIQLSLTPLREQNGQVSGHLGIATDVTARRAAERERDRAEQEVKDALVAISQARDEAMAANQAKSAFLATMSHEIRTPMNAVIGMTGLLLDSDLDDEQRDLLETVRSSGDQLLAIINDILDFSKIEAGDLDLEVRAFDLRDLVEGTVAQFAGSAKGLDLISHVDAACPATVAGDITRLRQVISNLIGNAIKFTAEGDVLVQVQVLDEPGPETDGLWRLRFEVRDTGIGIPAAAMGRLFKSFSQVDASTTRNYGGTGLGLAISKALVEAMGGEIWVESEMGAGSNFIFTVLLGAAPALAEARPGRMSAGDLRAALRGRRALIVDDNDNNRRILHLQLSGQEMETVDVARPSEALRLLGEPGQHFDIAVLDLAMPVMDGVQLATAIRRQSRWANLPLLLLSSLGRRLGAEEDLFAAILTKPVRSGSLLEALAKGIAVPADSGPAGSDTAIPAPRAPRPAADHAGPVLAILLAEDNEVNQKVGRLMLAKLGHRIDIVSNGQEAVAAARAKDYDLILMDMHMPVLDGLEATRQIRAELPSERQPRIIALTASVTLEDREACTAAGMDGYLSKPVRPDDLSEFLAQAQEVEHG